MEKHIAPSPIESGTRWFDQAAADRSERPPELSREIMRKAFDAEHVAIAVSRASDGRYLFVNSGFSILTGYARHEILGTTSRELNFMTAAQRRRLMTTLAKHGRLKNQELTFKTKTGDSRTILFSIGPVDVGDERCLLATMVDITERKRVEEALRTSEDKFRSLFESMAAGCCIDEVVYENGRAVDYRIIDVNPSYEKIMGVPREAAVGALGSQVYGTGEAPFLDILAKVAETGEPAVFESYFEPIGKHLKFTVSRPHQGRFSTVFHDITPQKEFEKELLRKQEELEANFRELERMNTALNVLIEHLEKEKRTVYEDIGRNLGILVLPLLRSLKAVNSMDAVKTYVGIIERNIQDIMAGFPTRTTETLAKLTPLETRISQLIAEGKTTKEIAVLLGKSVRAVSFHRENIRKKLRLKHTKTNLSAYLRSHS